MKIHVGNSSYGRKLNLQTKGLAYIAAFCTQFVELGCSKHPQSLGGKCSISLIITYHNTPVPRVNVFGGKVNFVHRCLYMYSLSARLRSYGVYSFYAAV